MSLIYSFSQFSCFSNRQLNETIFSQNVQWDLQTSILTFQVNWSNQYKNCRQKIRKKHELKNIRNAILINILAKNDDSSFHKLFGDNFLSLHILKIKTLLVMIAHHSEETLVSRNTFHIDWLSNSLMAHTW